ncbi:MAG: glycosyl hydrolase [Idiomarinaceae bacterium]|nr:glycosyl hydrolase [Idiomarinaceae bacterium]
MKNVGKRLSALGVGALLAASGAFIAVHEGYVPGDYVDPVGIQTACFGHTATVNGANVSRTDEECLELLADDLASHNRELLSAVKIELSRKEHMAYLSFHYNLGAHNFNRSTLLRKLNAGHRYEACKELSRWIYAGGQKLPGLVNRRSKERELCLEGVTGHAD